MVQRWVFASSFGVVTAATLGTACLHRERLTASDTQGGAGTGAVVNLPGSGGMGSANEGGTGGRVTTSGGTGGRVTTSGGAGGRVTTSGGTGGRVTTSGGTGGRDVGGTGGLAGAQPAGDGGVAVAGEGGESGLAGAAGGVSTTGGVGTQAGQGGLAGAGGRAGVGGWAGGGMTTAGGAGGHGGTPLLSASDEDTIRAFCGRVEDCYGDDPVQCFESWISEFEEKLQWYDYCAREMIWFMDCVVDEGVCTNGGAGGAGGAGGTGGAGGFSHGPDYDEYRWGTVCTGDERVFWTVCEIH